MGKSRLTRRGFLKAMGAGAASLAWPRWLRAAAPVKPDRPNIVLIMADDMGYSDIGCYGGEVRTPNLDKLAAGGLRFTQFYNTARCCPTRASLLTGLYPHQAGVGHMTDNYGSPSYLGHLNDRCVTIAEALRAGGYRALMTGKWHVGSKVSQWPLDRGFDRFYGIPEGGGSYFTLPQGRTLVLDDKSVRPPDKWYSTDAWTDYALQFIDEAAGQGGPFFLYLAHNAPHWPLQALPEDIARYQGTYAKGWDALRAERHARMIEMGLVEKSWPLTDRDKSATPWDQVPADRQADMAHRMAVYAAQIDRMDRGIGRVVDKLRQIGALDNTLVLFLADNGGCAEGGPWGFTRNEEPVGTAGSFASYGLAWANASNTPFRLYKHWVHEGGIATPLIAHWPAVIRQKGQLNHECGHVVDIMATCLDAAGVEYPRARKGTEIVPLEGKSLLPVFRGGTRQGHDAIFWEHEGNRAVRQGRWKLVARHGGPWELFDLRADRTEMKDLAATQAEKARELAALYDAWARRCGVLPWPVRRNAAQPQGKQAKKKSD